jgi:ABC-type sulfate transport system permease component
MNYGLLTLVAKRTRKAVVLSVITSFITLVISFVYFHILAYTLMTLSFIFYSLALVVRSGQGNESSIRDISNVEKM